MAESRPLSQRLSAFSHTIHGERAEVLFALVIFGSGRAQGIWRKKSTVLQKSPRDETSSVSVAAILHLRDKLTHLCQRIRLKRNMQRQSGKTDMIGLGYRESKRAIS